MRRVSFSNEGIDIAALALHHSDVENSLRSYFSSTAASYATRFTGYTNSEVELELDERLAELDMTSSLTILSAIEAVFRIDYLQRCYRKEKDPLSRAFRDLNKRRGSKVSLEDEILGRWKMHTDGGSELIGDLRGAFKYRHWLAHGRYWNPKFGKKYDFVSLYALASATLTYFPLLRLDPS
uniref:RiboL-PSP-HEPN domain-containing protein n=1 Tax=Rhodopseudomonas palustris (strain BisA53) TaxID=316055 RepID=Q07QK5_RHOP5